MNASYSSLKKKVFFSSFFSIIFCAVRHNWYSLVVIYIQLQTYSCYQCVNLKKKEAVSACAKSTNKWHSKDVKHKHNDKDLSCLQLLSPGMQVNTRYKNFTRECTWAWRSRINLKQGPTVHNNYVGLTEERGHVCGVRGSRRGMVARFLAEAPREVLDWKRSLTCRWSFLGDTHKWLYLIHCLLIYNIPHPPSLT